MSDEIRPDVALLRRELVSFMDDHVYPSEDRYDAELALLPSPHGQPAVMEELKAEARRRGLWNLFLHDARWGAGLSVAEFAPLAAIAARSPLGLEAINCAAPDTGNMELLAMFGTPEQQDRWLKPLLDGTIRSSFSMTEPDVASSDPTNLQATITRVGDEYVLNGVKWWTSGVLDDRCELIVFLGRTREDGRPHGQYSTVLVPRHAPGVEVLRDLTMFGYSDKMGHGEVAFRDVRVPVSNLLGDEHAGFAMAQARLGPGRIHYGMRAIGMAERALELTCRRALQRRTFGTLLADKSSVQEGIARSRIEIDQARALIMDAARLIDREGNAAARTEIAKVKVAAMAAAERVLDRAVQVFGAAGVSEDFPIARMYALTRALRIADGPDEVHIRSVARTELREYRREAELAGEPVAVRAEA